MVKQKKETTEIYKTMRRLADPYEVKTDTELARRLKTSPSAINNIKFGIRGLGPRMKERFKKEFHAKDVDFLVTNDRVGDLSMGGKEDPMDIDMLRHVIKMQDLSPCPAHTEGLGFER